MKIKDNVSPMTELGQKNIPIIVQNDHMRSMILVIGILFFALVSFPVLLSEMGQTYVLILLLLTAGYFTFKVIYFLQAKKYRQVKAEINDYYLIEHQRYDEESRMPSLDYEVRIHYTYQYNGKQYHSDKVGMDKSQYYFKQKSYFTDEHEARNDSLKYLNAVAENPNLTAYVNPWYPKEAVLDINVKPEVMALNIMFGLMAMAAFLWMVTR